MGPVCVSGPIKFTRAGGPPWGSVGLRVLSASCTYNAHTGLRGLTLGKGFVLSGLTRFLDPVGTLVSFGVIRIFQILDPGNMVDLGEDGFFRNVNHLAGDSVVNDTIHGFFPLGLNDLIKS